MIEFRPFQKIFGGFSGRKVLPWHESNFPAHDFIQLKQVHGDGIQILLKAEDLASSREVEADAVISALPGKGLMIRTADCVPILVAHPQGVVAAVHAGWRGTVLQILKKTLGKMQSEFGLDLEQAYMEIGPAICQGCYTVGEEVAKLFLKGSEVLQKKGNGKYLLDLKRANHSQAREMGIPNAHIRVCPECTFCRVDLYYSYRHAMTSGETNTGRNYSWVLLAP